MTQLQRRLRASPATVLVTLIAGWINVAAQTAVLHAAVGRRLRPFTVADAIERTELADLHTVPHSHDYSRSIRMSPDGRQFIVVTRRGDLRADENEYRLLLFETSEVREFVNSPKRVDLPKAITLAVFRTTSNCRAIDQARWLDNETVAFIGRARKGIGELYTVNVATEIVRQASFRKDTVMGVMTYDYSLRSGAAIYSAAVAPDWTGRNSRGYIVDSLNVQNLTARDPDGSALLDVGYFLLPPGSRKAQLLDIPLLSKSREWGSLPFEQNIAISPDGHWAVAIGGVQHPPTNWVQYPFVQAYRRQLASICANECVPMDDREVLESLSSQEPTAPRSAWMQQYYLVNMADGAVAPLIDAPTGFPGRAHIVWSADSKRVFVAPTLLPLTEDRRTRPGDAQAAVVVEVPSKRASLVTDQDANAITDAVWNAGDLTVEWRRAIGTAAIRKRFRYHAARWDAMPSPTTDRGRLLLGVKEDMNTPPEIEAADSGTGRKRVITDFNPQFRHLSLGHMVEFHWEDRQQRAYVGGLLFPPDFKRGKRYPVVLQTDGFYPSEFLVDGPLGMSTAYSARALAGRGMLVLQMPRYESGKRAAGAAPPWQYKLDGENPRFMAMTEGAIDALAHEGLIDRNRVGLIGFSREGMHVQYTITFSKYPFAAATIADSVQMGVMTYYLFYGETYPNGMFGMESRDMLGASLWGAGVHKWVDRAPAFHADRIHTPLRIEHHGALVPYTWETYTNLKYHRRPVEMIHIPDAAHILERPLARYVSEEEDVDWFTFWLKGESDPDASKGAQYERWRELRVLRDCAGCRRDTVAGVDNEGSGAHAVN